MTETLNIELQKDSLAIVKLEPGKTVPDWASADSGGFVSITQTAEEVSIVCAANQVPDDVQAERGWTALKIIGPLRGFGDYVDRSAGIRTDRHSHHRYVKPGGCEGSGDTHASRRKQNKQQ